jgi:hypothetical protein
MRQDFTRAEVLVAEIQVILREKHVAGSYRHLILSVTQVIVERRAGDLCEGAGEAHLLHAQGRWPGDSDHVQCQVRLSP